MSHFVGATSRRTLRTLNISLLLAMLMFGYVLGCSDGSDHEGPEWAPPPGVVFESLDRQPVPFKDALDLIRQGDVHQIVLQPDAYHDGAARWYEYTSDDGSQRWDVNGVNVLLFTYDAPQAVVITSSGGTVGVGDQQLQTLLDAAREASRAGIHIDVIDDREWWAEGKPMPYRENVVDLE